MTNRKDILAELQDLSSPLTEMPVAMPYRLPEGYFEQLPERLLGMVRNSAESTNELEELAPLLSQAPRTNPYHLPNGYFDSLDLSFVFNEETEVDRELAAISPLLGSLKKEMPFSIPEDYFEKNNIRSEKSQSIENKQAKVIGIGRSWIRYAAAAIVVGFVAISAVLYFNTGDQDTGQGTGLAVSPIEETMKNVSTDDITEFIELAVDDSKTLAQTTPSAEIKSLMKDVSDSEIQEFLNDTQLADADNSDDELFLN